MSERLKQIAAESAVELVRDGDVVGLGTGSTTYYAIRALGERIRREGLSIKAIPTSVDTRIHALEFGIPITTFEEFEQVDIAIDGADQVSGKLELVKGGGGALFREKVVACNAKRFIVIADESKLVERLSMPIPIEVLPFAWRVAERELVKIGAKSVALRRAKGKVGPLITDNGNYLLDADFGEISEPEKLEARINRIVGVLENGLFSPELVSEVRLGTKEGVRVLTP
ncbi:MAG: ribose-5-phosphate isomerase RpiA [Euryarchaeota archaeon]|nr:ribose-5-phosphate isomerase RpiA [Euryarchaeota archaeon]